MIGELINNTKYYRIEGWPNFQSTYVDRKFVDKNKFSDNEISEASHIYMAHYANGDCGIFLRSLPNGVSCRDIMEKMKIGGGHDRSAGGTFKTNINKQLSVADCINQVLGWIRLNMPTLR